MEESPYRMIKVDDANERHIDVYTLDDQVYTVPLKEIRLNMELRVNENLRERKANESRKYFFTDSGMPENFRQWHAISEKEYDRIRNHLTDRLGLIERSGTETLE